MAKTSSPSAAAVVPVNTLDSTLARSWSLSHPAILLVSSYYFFPALVADPIDTLTNALLPLGIFQAISIAICLPSANETAYKATASAQDRKSGRASLTADLGLSARIIPAILSLILALTAGPPLLAAALVLFGAPFTTHQFQTMLCGAHMSVLASLPLVYVHGVESQRWLDIVSLKVPVDETLGGALGTLIGAWLGAIPIPLDWDRAWQKWPVTVVVGAYLGYVIGKLAGGTVFRGKSITF